MTENHFYIYTAIIALFCAMIFVRWLNAIKYASPFLMLAYRWLRCAFFSLALGMFLKGTFLQSHSLALLALCSFMLYFLMETLLYWMQISAINFADYSMFAPYREVETAWSAQKEHIELKRKIEAEGFKKSGSMKSSPIDGADIMLTTFDSPDKKIRLGVAFLPAFRASFLAASAVSASKNGKVLYTEGNPTPFGLAYPENYEVGRHPLISNPLRILKIHRARMEASGHEFVPITSEPVNFMNDSLKELQRAGIKAGLLNAPQDIEDEGMLTADGKYSIWKDMIAVNYFPFKVK